MGDIDVPRWAAYGRMVVAVVIVVGVAALFLPVSGGGHAYSFEIEFTVFDGNSGRPIDGASISVDPALLAREVTAEAVTDSRGKAKVKHYIFVNDRSNAWRWEFRVPEQCQVRVNRPGYQQKLVALQDLLDDDSPDPKSKTATLTIRMQPLSR